jgi:hypothetical protein
MVEFLSTGEAPLPSNSQYIGHKAKDCLNSACLITPSTFKNTFNLCLLWQLQPTECDVAHAATRRVHASKPQRSNAALQAIFTDGNPT